LQELTTRKMILEVIEEMIEGEDLTKITVTDIMEEEAIRMIEVKEVTNHITSKIKVEMITDLDSKKVEITKDIRIKIEIDQDNGKIEDNNIEVILSRSKDKSHLEDKREDTTLKSTMKRILVAILSRMLSR
jgi:hypothetical protein